MLGPTDAVPVKKCRAVTMLRSRDRGASGLHSKADIRRGRRLSFSWMACRRSRVFARDGRFIPENEPASREPAALKLHRGSAGC